MTLEPPFPYFGGKSRVADLVWSRLGDCRNYIEPFFGSGAALLRRPHYPWRDEVCRRETINDLDGHIANFWRACQADPEGVAAGADRIVHELDLHAVGDRLFCSPQSREFIERMRGDEDFFDAEWAGAWCWFTANWIGGLPSVGGENHQNEDGVHRRRPHLGDAGQGVSRQLPHLGDAGQGECSRRREVITDWMRQLSDRLRNVRCCCGDWSRVCGPSVTWKNATPCAVFLDPPYADTAGRDGAVYATDSLTVAHDVREWAIAEGEREGMRIALCGYEGEHEMPGSWECVPWKATGGYGNQGDGAGRENAYRERIWFSPGCLKPERERVLFDD